MNRVITIPKGGDFVLVPQKEYESLLKKQPKIIQVDKLSSAEKKAIVKSEVELGRGEYITLNELEHELASTRAKTR